MAHKKGGGSSRNGRDSNAQRLGVKRFGGQLVTIIVIPIVLAFSKNSNGGAGDATGWFAFAAIGGLIATAGAIILGIGTKEHASALRENKTDTSFSQVFSVLMKNDQLLWIAFAYLIFGLGQNLINNFNLYYFIYVLGDSSQFSFLGVINVIIGLMAVALFPSLTKKFIDKVGSSIIIFGKASMWSLSQNVSPIDT